MSIPPGITREHVLRAIADLDAGVDHPFGPATKYELIQGASRHPPKAVVGVAARLATGATLGPEDFNSGWGPGQACHYLSELGFTIQDLPAPASPSAHWTDQQVALVVADYFDMLRAELSLVDYNKAAHRRALRDQLGARSHGSVEFKHQNISAVLVGMGLPYISGYKPRSNYQHSLISGIESYLSNHPNYYEDLINAPAASPSDDLKIVAATSADLIVRPPEAIAPLDPTSKPWLTRTARRTDFRRRDAENRSLGRMGEQLVVDLERRSLAQHGREDLAERVEWSSEEIGDGLGYDVRSFDPEDESERLIEVKTTGLGIYFPFYLTRNELRCSEDVPDRFRLYRVFDYARSPHLYVLEGSMSEACHLQPVNYRATPQATSPKLVIEAAFGWKSGWSEGVGERRSRESLPQVPAGQGLMTPWPGTCLG